MSESMSVSSGRAQWTSNWVFIFAIAGLVVGLGGVWNLPFVLSENGGAAFVYSYILIMLLIIWPVTMIEIRIGQSFQANPVSAVSGLVQQRKVSKVWVLMACLALLAAICVLANLSVTGGWNIFYLVKSVSNGFKDMPGEMVQGEYGVLLANPKQLIIWQTVFMLSVVGIASRDFKSGSELAFKFLMPVALGILVSLLVYALSSMESADAIALMFQFDAEKFTLEVIGLALVFAVFTSGLAVGSVMMLGSFLPHRTSTAGISFLVVLLNLLLVLVAVLLVCLLALNADVELALAPSLLYQSLPVIFTDLPKGMFMASVFYFALLCIVLGAALALIEPVAGWLSERFSIKRQYAIWGVSGFLWLLGIVSALSQNIWAFEFDFLSIEKTKGVADIFAVAANNFIVPFGVFLLALFAGKKSTKSFFREEFALPGKLLFKVWRFVVRFVCFLALAYVFLSLMFGQLFTYDECMITFQLGDLTIRFELCNH